MCEKQCQFTTQTHTDTLLKKKTKRKTGNTRSHCNQTKIKSRGFPSACQPGSKKKEKKRKYEYIYECNFYAIAFCVDGPTAVHRVREA